MSKAYEFLKECGAFFVLSVNGDYPAGRPFGVVWEFGDDLYIATNDNNQAHKQIRLNGHVQLLAKKADSREWLRVTGTATECTDLDLKTKMIEENPVLVKHYSTPENEHFILFKIKVENVEFK